MLYAVPSPLAQNVDGVTTFFFRLNWHIKVKVVTGRVGKCTLEIPSLIVLGFLRRQPSESYQNDLKIKLTKTCLRLCASAHATARSTE